VGEVRRVEQICHQDGYHQRAIIKVIRGRDGGQEEMVRATILCYKTKGGVRIEGGRDGPNVCISIRI
jgi:hypothetical protein